MKRIRATIVAATKQLPAPRDKTFLVVIAALPHLTYDQLRHLTVSDALHQLQELTTPLAQTALGLINRTTTADQKYLFASRKNRGTTPATRQTIWRLLQKAIGGGLKTLRKLLTGRAPPSTPVTTSAPHTATRSLGEASTQDDYLQWKYGGARRAPT